MQVGGESWVGELSGSVVVVHKVDPTSSSVPNLPAWRQRTQFLTVDVAQVPGGTHTHTESIALSHTQQLHLPQLRLQVKSRASPGNSGVVPRADSSLGVQKVDLTLLGRPLL